MAGVASQAQVNQWIRPSAAGDPLMWGRRDGIVFGLPSTGGMPGPRGLIRVGTLDSKSGQVRLLNYIAIEPVTEGKETRGKRMAFSELERSHLDRGQRGARLWVSTIHSSAEKLAGYLTDEAGTPAAVETLSVRVEVERFPKNGSHLYAILSIRSDHPNELRLSAYPYPDSKPIDEMTFTATMGAYERLRYLWLKDSIVDSRKLYSTYRGINFAELDSYPLKNMLSDSWGDPIAICTSSEATPSASRNKQAKPHWFYDGPRITQYWKVPIQDVQPNLRVRVNGRHTYWNSKDLIPGGTTFENFELRQTFSPGQTFIFGIQFDEPSEWHPSILHLAESPVLE
jgi:hypothetical protein